MTEYCWRHSCLLVLVEAVALVTMVRVPPRLLHAHCRRCRSGAAITRVNTVFTYCGHYGAQTCQ